MSDIRTWVVDDIEEFLGKMKVEYNIDEVKYFFERLNEAGEDCLNDGAELADKSNVIFKCTRGEDKFNLILDSELRKKGLEWRDDEVREIGKE